MAKYMSTIFIVLLVMTCIYHPTGAGRKPPFNGSIFGKRFLRDMDVDSRGGDFRHPACEYVYEACNQWYTSGTDSQ